MNLKDKNSFEELVRNAVGDYEMPYNQNDWLRLEKDLPKPNGWTPAKTAITIVASVIIITGAVIGIYKFYNNDKNTENEFVTEEIFMEITPVENQNLVVEPDNKVSLEKNNVSENKEIYYSYDNKIDEKQKKTEPEAKNETNRQETESKNEIENKTTETNEDKPADEIIPIALWKNKVPSAKFMVDIDEGCTPLRVNLFPMENADTIIYLWEFGDGSFSTEMQPQHIFEEAGDYSVSLTTKYFKSDRTNYSEIVNPIKVKLAPVADFSWTEQLYTFSFENSSENAYSWKWYVNGLEASSTENLVKDFYTNGQSNVKLMVWHLNGCSNSVSKDVEVKISHNLQFAEAFTPNGNGKNDYFGPMNVDLSDYQYNMQIYNRLGQLVFETNDPGKFWDGKIIHSDKLAKLGVFTYIVTLKDQYGNAEKIIGDVTLLDLQNE